ncbi:MAG: hypothetical protein IJY27_00805 [Clostridia bacterium]|nr:hypothetical protein [Clostridia bacterium]
MPDISLIVALANFFDITTDELLCRTAKKDAELEAFYERDQKLSQQGDVPGRLAVWREATQKYPGDYDCLKNLADALMATIYIDGEFEEQDRNAKEAVEICERILRDCTDSKTRNLTIQTLVLLHSSHPYSVADEQKAVEYANQAPGFYCCRENLLEHAYFTEQSQNKKIERKHQNNLHYLDCITMNMYLMRDMPPEYVLAANFSAIKLWETLIPDGNFLFYHCRLRQMYDNLAACYAKMGNADETIKALENALFHAHAFDCIPEGDHSYTSPFVCGTEYSTSGFSKNYTDSDVELVKKFMKSKKFDFIRDNERFIALMQKNF